MNRRTFLGTTLGAAGLSTCNARLAGAVAQNAAPEPLVWPLVTKPQAGIRSFAGHTDTVLDVIGRLGTAFDRYTSRDKRISVNVTVIAPPIWVAICAKGISCMRFAAVRMATSPVPP